MSVVEKPRERTRSGVGETRHAAFAFEIDTRTTNVAEGRFGGYASVFNTLIPSYNEIVDPGAFDETLKKRGDRVRVLWQHDPSDPIGIPVSMEEDAIGLKVVAQLADTPKIRGEYLPLLMPNTDGRAVVDRMSIGFRILDDYRDADTGVYHLRAVDLFEFSPVTFPANESAIISNVRSDVLQLAKRAMGIADERKPMSADDAQYAMAILMGARGSGSFTDLPADERRGLFERLSSEYERHGLTPPEVADFGPQVYTKVKFAASELSVYAGRSLRKRLSDVTSAAQHAARLGVPFDSECVAEAEAALDAISALGLGGVQGRMDRIAEADALSRRLGITLT